MKIPAATEPQAGVRGRSQQREKFTTAGFCFQSVELPFFTDFSRTFSAKYPKAEKGRRDTAGRRPAGKTKTPDSEKILNQAKKYEKIIDGEEKMW